MTRPPIVVLHGALGSAAQMQPMADALSAIGEVHCLELPGHGDTQLPDAATFSMATFANALRDAITLRGWHQPLVFGYSMGGYVALLLESLSPGTLGGIVTLGTKFEWTPDVAAGAAARLDAAVLQSKAPAFAEQLRVRHAGAGGWEQMMVRTAALLVALGATPLLTAETLASVQIPLRVAAGSRDDTLAEGEAGRLAALLPNATCTPLPDVPHPIERVPTALVVDLVGGLLRDLSRS
ncbi:alpha/beta fold hydrolase [Gemmatimonas sp.]|uniref:alpha/beta fold hydrolase n=1 Tax=Gemmatimonas sp. TaxID=1962908 RepID=UPI00286E8F24|nr:alpha/beta fold hydrolase [Gemmatimonas sp.]